MRTTVFNTSKTFKYMSALSWKRHLLVKDICADSVKVCTTSCCWPKPDALKEVINSLCPLVFIFPHLLDSLIELMSQY